MRPRGRQERGRQGVKERPPGPAALSLNLSRRCCKSEGFVAGKRPINDRREDL